MPTMWRGHSTQGSAKSGRKVAGFKNGKQQGEEDVDVRTLEEHAERFYGKRPGLLMRMVRFKGLVITSVLVVGILLTLVMSLD